VAAGKPFSGSAAVVNPTFAGLSSAGLYQIDIVIPAGLGTGDVSLQATAGGVQTLPGIVISLQ
jgi:uncharacterized protein (TIGR03437 family)